LVATLLHSQCILTGVFHDPDYDDYDDDDDDDDHDDDDDDGDDHDDDDDEAVSLMSITFQDQCVNRW